MPEICRFFGIIIRKFLIDREHPPRHIHIKYGYSMAVMEPENLNIVEGAISKHREWAELHQEGLITMWDTQSFRQIEPLE